MNDAPTPPRPLESLLADRDWVRVMARRLVRDPGRAEDLEQQAWLAAIQRPPADGRSPRGWFATVLRRAAGRGRREDWRRGRRERAAARSEAAPSTLHVVAQAEWHERVVRAVLDLPEPYRTTLLLRYLEDLPPREVARRMGAPVETVRSRAQRAVALLRERFDAERGGRDGWAPAVAVLGAGAPRGGLAEDPAWDAPVPALPGPAAGEAAATGGAPGALVALGLAVLAVGGVLIAGRLRDPGGRGVAGGAVAALDEGGDASGPSRGGGALAAHPAAAPARATSGAGRLRASGRAVRAADGSPVAGARVLVVPLDPMARSVAWSEVGTDAAGRFSIHEGDLAPAARDADVMVVAMAEGLATEGLGSLDPFGWNPLVAVAGGDATRDLALRLVPAKRFHGRVEGPDGKPAAGARVEAWWRFGPARGEVPFDRPLDVVEADAAGRFAFDGWGADQAGDLVATRPGSFPSRLRDMAAGADDGGAFEVREEHRIPRSRALAVEVVARDGGPVAGVRLRAEEAGSDLRTWQRPFRAEWTTAADGRVTAESVPDVPLVVRVVPYGSARGEARAEPGTTSLRVVVEERAGERTEADGLPEDGARFAARVLSADGGPAIGARFLGWSRANGFASWGRAEGAWSDLSPGPRAAADVVEVFGARSAADGAPLAAAFRALAHDPDAMFRLVPEVVVDGEVEAPAGAALRGTLVRARPARWDGVPLREDLCVASARVDDRGAFRLRGLGSEPYRLTVAAPPGLVLAGGSRLAPPGGGRVTLRLVPAN